MAGFNPAIQCQAQPSALDVLDGRLKGGHDVLRGTSLFKPEHQLDVLNCGAGGALAEIVEARDENGLIEVRLAEDEQFELVRGVQRLGLEPRRFTCSTGHDFDELR